MRCSAGARLQLASECNDRASHDAGLTLHRASRSIAPVMHVLAATETSSASILFWTLVLVAILVLAFVGVVIVKKRMRTEDDEPVGPVTGFTLSDLRRLHKEGQVSDEEFERAKAKIVASAKAAAARSTASVAKDPLGRPIGGPDDV